MPRTSRKRKLIPVKTRERVYLKSLGKCVDCGLTCGGGWHANWSGRVKTFELNGTHEIHHIIPVSKGGNESIDNLILLCISCHRNRHTKESLNER
jgi:5-methylcytosine-specific restriction endonuclease McrA